MRLAWVSPLPPTRSGIADYSVELLPALSRAVQITLFSPPPFEPLPSFKGPLFPLENLPAQAAQFDLILYHLGNNPYHVDIYNLALRLPGAIVLHDYLLHNLVARCTIHIGDLAGYLLHLAYERGPEGIAAGIRRWHSVFSQDEYFLTPLNRLVLASSRGVIVHSQWAASQVRQDHSGLLVRHVPHHLALIPPRSRQEARRQLGLAPDEIMLAGFGFLTRYKRIDRLLQSYAQLRQEHPQVRCFLVGEPEPALNLPEMLTQWDLGDHVTVTGYVGLEQFYTYIAACDIAVNLRYPSAGETSGALIRLLGSGKAVIISNVQQFAEWPDSTCLKVDLGPAEGPMLLYYMRRLVEDRSLRRQLGENARHYVEVHHSLTHSAQSYLDFFRELLGAGAMG